MDLRAWIASLHKIPTVGLILSSLSVGTLYARPSITIVSDPWPQYLDANGGYFINLSKKIFEPYGYFISYENVPFPRALLLVKSGNGYIAPALYNDPRPGILYAKTFTAMDVAAVIVNTDQVHWKNKISVLSHKKIAWIRGFHYREVLNKTGPVVAITQYEVNSRESGLAMLKQGRIDAYMDNGDGLQAYARSQGMHEPKFAIHEVFRRGLYFGFANTQEGRKLKAIFDSEINKLIDHHSLDKIYHDSVKNGPGLKLGASH